MRILLIGLLAAFVFVLVTGIAYVAGFIVWASIVGWGQGLEGSRAATGGAIVALAAFLSGLGAAFLAGRWAARRW